MSEVPENQKQDDDAVARPDDAAPREGTDAHPDDADSRSDDVVQTAPVVELIDPATVRRAPRFRAFLWAGMVVGVLIGLVVGLIVFPSNDWGWTLAIFVAELAAAGVLLAAVVAVLVDRRSLRRR